MNELKADIRHLKELVRKADKLEQKIGEIKDNGFYMVDTDGNIDDYYFRRRTDSLNKQDGTLSKCFGISRLNSEFDKIIFGNLKGEKKEKSREE